MFGGFDYADSGAVRDELKAACRELELNNLCGVESPANALPDEPGGLQKVGRTPIYAVDDMLREAAPLQATPLARAQRRVIIGAEQARKSRLEKAEQVQVKQDGATAVLPLAIDDSVPTGCVYVPQGIDETRALGGAFGKVTLEKVS